MDFSKKAGVVSPRPHRITALSCSNGYGETR